MTKIKLLVVDLDNTLCDTFHTLSKWQWAHTAKVLESHGIPKDKSEQMLRSLGKYSFKTMMDKIGLDAKLKKIAIAAYDDVDVSKLKLFSDADAIINYPLPKVLVTRGERKLQRAKIKHLGIRLKFKKVYYVSTFDKKKDTFRLILKDFGYKPSEILVIGDRIEEEIKDAKSLRMKTAFINRPDWPSHPSAATPDISVKTLDHMATRIDEMQEKG